MQDSVTVRMAAPAQRIWELVSDVSNTSAYSEETFEAEWLDGATGPAVGVRFRGHVLRNGRPPAYWVTCRITASEPGRVFAFVATVGGRDVNHWRYELAPVDDGTEVTESFRLQEAGWAKVYWALFGTLRGRTNRRNMRRTLERIQALVEAG